MTAQAEARREAVARTIREHVRAKTSIDSVMRRHVWVDGADEAADAIIAAHIAPETARAEADNVALRAKVEGLRKERDSWCVQAAENAKAADDTARQLTAANAEIDVKTKALARASYALTAADGFIADGIEGGWISNPTAPPTPEIVAAAAQEARAALSTTPEGGDDATG